MHLAISFTHGISTFEFLKTSITYDLEDFTKWYLTFGVKARNLRYIRHVCSSLHFWQQELDFGDETLVWYLALPRSVFRLDWFHNFNSLESHFKKIKKRREIRNFVSFFVWTFKSRSLYFMVMYSFRIVMVFYNIVFNDIVFYCSVGCILTWGQVSYNIILT